MDESHDFFCFLDYDDDEEERSPYAQHSAECCALVPKYSHHDPDSLYQKDHPAFDALGITPEDFMERFSRYERDRGDYAHALGKFNPYTGEQIINEIAYTQYLREHFFYQLCSLNLERSMSIVDKAEQQAISDFKKLEEMQADFAHLVEDFATEQKEFSDMQASLYRDLTEMRDDCDYYEDYIKDLIDEADEKDEELRKLSNHRDELHRDLLDAQDKLSPRNRFRRALPLIFCVAFVTFLLTFYLGKPSWYDSGYQAGKQEVEESAYASGYEDGKRAGAEAGSYSAGYGDGKAIGEEQGYSRGYAAGQRASASSFSAGTGTGAARQSAIASGYIGNIGTGKFHTSSCSYLPNQENQIVFSSHDEAVAAGYSPCGHCL